MDLVHTFLDDLVASIAANAASRVAHRLRDEEEQVGTNGRVDWIEEKPFVYKYPFKDYHKKMKKRSCVILIDVI